MKNTVRFTLDRAIAPGIELDALMVELGTGANVSDADPFVLNVVADNDKELYNKLQVLYKYLGETNNSMKLAEYVDVVPAV